MKKIMDCLTKAHIRLLNNDRGAAMIEYALVVAAVALAAALILGDTSTAGSLMGKIYAKVSAISL